MNAFATSNITEPVKQFPAQSNIENSISKEELETLFKFCTRDNSSQTKTDITAPLTHVGIMQLPILDRLIEKFPFVKFGQFSTQNAIIETQGMNGHGLHIDFRFTLQTN